MRTYYKNLKKIEEKSLYEGLDSFFHKTKGKIEKIFLSTKKLKKQAKQILELSNKLSSLSDFEIDNEIKRVNSLHKLNKIKTVNDENYSFALVVEVAYRELGKRAYEVQIMGALALTKKLLIEMSTGEGKTITASLAASYIALRGKPIHIFTSNDYLAKRDAEILAPLYNRMNLEVSYVIGTMEKEERKTAYKKNIVYSTSKEIVADFLKDKMQDESGFSINKLLIEKNTNFIKKDYLLQGLEYAIIDEADSVLCDEATTPLIISSKKENKLLKESTLEAYELAKNFSKDKHYKVYNKLSEVSLTKEGEVFLKELSENLSGIWSIKVRREFLLKQALVAKELFHLNKQYIIKEDKIVIVDEKTGRIMDERSWSNGLHQAIEAKEKLELTDPTVTFSKISFQKFFRFYKHLCGMSGTLHNLQSELLEIYDLQTIKIPTRKKSKMYIYADRIFLNKGEREKALIEFIKDINSKKRPVLVGFTTVKESEEFAIKLRKEGVENITLNALYSEQEANIIKDAGEISKVTIATNMAGRGTDIHISDEVNDLGGLFVITTQRDKSRRVDLQFFGRCARQGQNGSAISFLCLEDEIFDFYLASWLKNFFKNNFSNSLVKKIAVYTYIYYQRVVEKDISKVRKKTLFKDFQSEESMSFSRVK